MVGVGRGDEERAAGTESAAELIEARIGELDDWRGETLARIRAVVKQADPEVVEEWKWQKHSRGLVA